ncbi:hypothetical protein [Paenibacillus durus]|uniref:Uncharacterized protein n=2 Tax=Paenibacillus durus TaxID=44251 RepID=A0A0F7FFD2_PAEDU|nr:hypothetical protein [Paenibacillus durus]AKG37350.1 hypothetical protein VK70_25085 [Paenibacillus durus ATCC 35681]
MLAEIKSPLRRFGGRGRLKNMLLDGRFKLNFDALDIALVIDVDLLDHGLEERPTALASAKVRPLINGQLSRANSHD